MMLHHVHALPVLVAAAAAFLLGAVWYSPILFGKKWAEAHGHTPEKLAALRESAASAYLVSFLCYVVMAAALSILVGRMDVTMVEGGVKLGGLLGIGIAAPLGLTALMFSQKRLATWVIDAGYQITYLIVMAVILVAWR